MIYSVWQHILYILFVIIISLDCIHSKLHIFDKYLGNKAIEERVKYFVEIETSPHQHTGRQDHSHGVQAMLKVLGSAAVAEIVPDTM